MIDLRLSSYLQVSNYMIDLRLAHIYSTGSSIMPQKKNPVSTP